MFPRSHGRILFLQNENRNQEIKRELFPSVLGGSHFFLRTVSFGFLRQVLRTEPDFRFFFKIRLGGFQGQQFSQNYEPSVFRDGSHKSVLTNHDLPKKKLHTGLQLGMKLNLAANFGAILSLPCPFFS
jgi:hypothetical protein